MLLRQMLLCHASLVCCQVAWWFSWWCLHLHNCRVNPPQLLPCPGCTGSALQGTAGTEPFMKLEIPGFKEGSMPFLLQDTFAPAKNPYDLHQVQEAQFPHSLEWPWLPPQSPLAGLETDAAARKQKLPNPSLKLKCFHGFSMAVLPRHWVWANKTLVNDLCLGMLFCAPQKVSKSMCCHAVFLWKAILQNITG